MAIRESRTLTAKAVPQANGWVRYNSVSGSSSSSSGSMNWTLLSLTSSVIMGMQAPKHVPLLWRTMALPRGLVQSLGAGPAENLHIENSQEPRNKMKILWKENMKWDTCYRILTSSKSTKRIIKSHCFDVKCCQNGLFVCHWCVLCWAWYLILSAFQINEKNISILLQIR